MEKSSVQIASIFVQAGKQHRRPMAVKRHEWTETGQCYVIVVKRRFFDP